MGSDAIIFIPGIKGTKLLETNRANFDTIWSGIQCNFETIQDLELTQKSNGRYFDENINTIIKAGEIEALAYGEFLKDLKTDKPIFIFNYDWRLSAKENGKLLCEFLDYLVEKSKARIKYGHPFQKFDFITHSLGNFILRNYLKRKGFSMVNKIVFTAPPFQGSIDIASAAIVGEEWFPNVKAKIRKLIRTFPGALELLPTYSQASCFDTQPLMHNFFNTAHWQENILSPANPSFDKFSGTLSEANDTIQNHLCDLNALAQEEKNSILVICRSGYNTFQSIRIFRNKEGEPNNFFDFAGSCRTKDGDGRVPLVSSCCYSNSILTLKVEDSLYYQEYSHGFILKDERVQKLTNRFLFGNGSFDYQIPGGSVQKVSNLTMENNSDGLPYWHT